MKYGYKRRQPGKFWVRTQVGHREPMIFPRGVWVWPVIHRLEQLDMTPKAIQIDCSGTQGLVCRDGVGIDVQATFHVGVRQTAEDAIMVAQAIGCDRANDPETMKLLFSAKLEKTLADAAQGLDFKDLEGGSELFRERITEELGVDLNGYELVDLKIDRLDRSHLEASLAS